MFDRARAHQVEELVAVAVDAETVRQRHRDFAAGRMRVARRQPDRLLGARRVPEIALEIGDLGARRLVGLDVLRARARRRRRDRCSSSARRPASRRSSSAPSAAGRCSGLVSKATPCARMSWRVDLAELVVRDLAEEGGAAAKAGDACRRVAGAAARGFQSPAPCGCRADSARSVSIRFIAPLMMPFSARNASSHCGDDVDDGVADAEHVVVGSCRSPGCAGWSEMSLWHARRARV